MVLGENTAEQAFAENNVFSFFLYEVVLNIYEYQHQVSRVKTCIEHFTKTFYKPIAMFYWRLNTLIIIKQYNTIK